MRGWIITILLVIVAPLGLWAYHLHHTPEPIIRTALMVPIAETAPETAPESDQPEAKPPQDGICQQLMRPPRGCFDLDSLQAQIDRRAPNAIKFELVYSTTNELHRPSGSEMVKRLNAALPQMVASTAAAGARSAFQQMLDADQPHDCTAERFAVHPNGNATNYLLRCVFGDPPPSQQQIGKTRLPAVPRGI